MYDRMCYTSDYDTDGGGIDACQVSDYVQLFSAGTVTAAQIKTFFSFTTAQGTDLDTLLATMPTTLLTLLNLQSRLQWGFRIGAVLDLTSRGAAFTTPTAIKAALGV